MFDQIASRYDMINHILSFGTDKLWRKKAAGILAKYKPDHILDVACGTADSSISMHQAIKNARITGIDISSEMMRLGQKKIQKKNLSRMISLSKCEAENIVFQNASFDAITVLFGIRNFQNREKALHEMHRVLKPQGILMIVEFSLPRSKVVNSLYKLYLFHIFPIIGGILSGNKPAYRYFVQSVKDFPAPGKFCIQLENCGFTIENSRPLSGGIAWVYMAKKDEAVKKEK